MLRFFATSVMVFLLTIGMEAHYLVYSSSEGVQIESGGIRKSATKGLEVKANDYIIIPEGMEIEIYNDLDKNIYKSISSGKISVTRLMIDAKKTASNNSKNVASRLRLAKNNSEKEGERIYVEKGMVRRSLEVFDPEANNLQVDSKTLATKILDFLKGKDNQEQQQVPVEIINRNIDSVGVYFKIINTMEFPVYFNVLKISKLPLDNNRRVEISSLGQPDGSYVLLPGQSLTKESFNGLPDKEIHLLVVTHFRYDLDEVVEETGNLIENQNSVEDNGINLPLLIKKL